MQIHFITQPTIYRAIKNFKSCVSSHVPSLLPGTRLKLFSSHVARLKNLPYRDHLSIIIAVFRRLFRRYFLGKIKTVFKSRDTP